MILKLALPVLAVAGAAGAFYASLRPAPASEPGIPMAASPYHARIAGSGLVESAGEEVAVAAALPGIVERHAVAAGARVGLLEPIAVLDGRVQRAALASAEADLVAAAARLADLRSLPRADDIPPAEARVARARADLALADDRLARAVAAGPGLGAEETAARRLGRDAAAAALAEAEAALVRLRAGATREELAVREAEVTQSARAVDARRVDLDRLVVKAPAAATVLRFELQPGEYATPNGSAVAILGDLDTLHVRAQIDERDTARFSASAAAVAIPRGQPGRRLDLAWVRTEPLVRPKRALTGDVSERVDTRVLEVMYRLPADAGLHPGQQVDVEIEVRP